MKIDFDKFRDGLAPAIIQDADRRRVLMLGYMNELALAATQESGRVTFYSRSRKCLWTKGETSGNYLAVRGIFADCDRDAILITAVPAGPVCHNGTATCFADEELLPHGADIIFSIERIVEKRRTQLDAGSYTSALFDSGIKRIAQKVGEEAVEVALESVAGDTDGLTGEAADLLFHLIVLLRAKDVSVSDVLEELRRRHKPDV